MKSFKLILGTIFLSFLILLLTIEILIAISPKPHIGMGILIIFGSFYLWPELIILSLSGAFIGRFSKVGKKYSLLGIFIMITISIVYVSFLDTRSSGFGNEMRPVVDIGIFLWEFFLISLICSSQGNLAINKSLKKETPQSGIS